MVHARHRFQLSFALINCAGCSAPRIRGVVCPDCARRPEPWEVNDRLVARRAAIEATIELLDQPEVLTAVEPFALEDLQQILGRLEDWLPKFFQAMRAIGGEQPEAAEKVYSAVKGISSESSLLAAAPRLRPWVLVVEYAEVCVSHLIRMVRCYLQALSAATPLRAQNKADEAQRHLDTAGLELEALSRFIDTLDSLIVSERVEEKIAALIRQAQQEFDVSDITALSSAADQQLARMISVPMVPSGGLGLQFSLQDIAARFYGDQQRYRRVVSDSYSLLAANPQLLSALAASPDFLPDLQASLLELNDASAQVMHALNSQSIPRQVGRAIIDVAASLVEGPGQLVAIALLAGTGRKTRPYERLRQDNATELLRAVRRHSDLEPLVRGFNLEVRTAQAHRMVRYFDDGITLDTKGASGKLSWHDLGDEVLTAYESAMACLVGLQVALAESGITTYSSDFYRSFGISPADLVTIGLIAEGCEGVSIVEGPGSWTIALTPPPAGKLFRLAGGISSLIPDEIHTLTFLAHQDSQVHVFAGPVEPLRAFSRGDVDGDSYGIATTRVLHLWTYNGVRCLTPPVVRCWASYQIHQLHLNSVANPIPKTRTLRSLALEIGDRELAEALTAVMRSSRLGDETDLSTTALVAKFDTWGAESVEFDVP
ncbi:hypothetical protein ACIP4T_01895 [Streptomyces massasporeus]|uniref:hypothetical protein n=1 Tax=Streptomyces massasporeus TaxID=67324 RepID=UPI0036E3B7E3